MEYDLTSGGYYLVIPAPVAEDMQLRERSKLIYGRIVQLAAATGYCYASNEALLDILSYKNPQTGAISRISERTLQSSLAELRNRGHIYMDTGPVPVKDGTGIMTKRRIFIGQKLAAPPPTDGGEENCTPADFCTRGVKKSAPPYNSKNNTSKNKPPIVPQEGDLSERLFERFWSAYPKVRRKAKKDARKAWDKLKPSLELCRVMAVALEAQKRSEEWTREGGRYIPLPATWLRGERWTDEVTIPPAAPYDEEGQDGI